MQRPSSIPWLWVAVGAAFGLILALVVGGFWAPSDYGAGGGTGDAGGEGAGGPMGFGPPPVEVVAAVEVIAAEPVQLLGSVAPLRESVVASEVEGLVAEVAVDEGDSVRAGQLLGKLRTVTLELDLQAASANREEAAARLLKFEAELARMTDLLKKQAISQREYDQAVADRDAQAQSVTRYKAEAERLAELIARARIAAPFSGLVAAVHVELGEWVDRGGKVVTLVDLSEVEVTVPIPERYVSQAEVARKERWPVEVTFDALDGTYEGRVKAVIPQANPQARTFPVLIAVDNHDGLIRGGMFARVLAQVGESVPSVLVPKDALVNRGERAFVYRVRQPPAAGAPAGGAPAGDPDVGTTAARDGADPAATPGSAPVTNVAEEIEVRLGQAFGAWRVVIGPIAEGDLMIVRGNERLMTGMSVEVVRHAEVAPPPIASSDLPIAVGRRARR